jgi:tetratricopeptide (TPR) repeat protein
LIVRVDQYNEAGRFVLDGKTVKLGSLEKSRRTGIHTTGGNSVMRLCLRFNSVFLGLLTLGLINVGLLPERVAFAQNTSWTDSIKNGFNKVFNPNGSSETADEKSLKEDQALSLHGNEKLSPKSRVAMAQLYEQGNRLAEAEQQYQAALKEKPDFLPAMLGYAQLQYQMNKPDKALQLYQQAVKDYPKEAIVYNNMGMFQAQRKHLTEAAAALKQAVEMDPDNKLYSNNYASVLVAQGKTREAFAVLDNAHGEAAVAHYNLGFLLNKKGQRQEAMRQFAMALEIDPTMAPAKRWYDYLMQQSNDARLAAAAATETPINDRQAARGSSDSPIPNRPQNIRDQRELAAAQVPASTPKMSNVASRDPSNASRMSYTTSQTPATLPMPPATLPMPPAIPQEMQAGPRAENRAANQPSARSQGIAARTPSRPEASRTATPLPPVAPLTRRLPATDEREPAAVSQFSLAQPNIPYDRNPSLVTPLPPVASRPTAGETSTETR